jgi:hypothetical protein
MSFTTFSGPVLSGTVKQNAGRNTGLSILTQSATVLPAVILTSPAAQALFVLPAGAKILRFRFEKTATITTATEIAVTIGDSGTANKYQTTANIGVTTAQAVAATLDAALVSSQTNNIGTADKTIYGTFTASTGNAAGGSVVVTVEYVQRADDGSQYPSGTAL